MVPPGGLTRLACPAQLKNIFSCRTTNWKSVGGKNAKIAVYLPQPGSFTLSLWEKLTGITSLGKCVSQAPAEDEGTYKGFKSPNAIFIYSVGACIAQKHHSAACGKKPVKSQNEFGCNETGVLSLGKTEGISPLTSAKVPVTNPKFPAEFWATVYAMTRYDSAMADHIEPALEGSVLLKGPARLGLQFQYRRERPRRLRLRNVTVVRRNLLTADRN